MVTAFCSASRTVLGQQSFRVAEGESEILAARKLLECLDLTGMLVTRMRSTARARPPGSSGIAAAIICSA